MIPYGRQDVTEDDVREVVSVLTSDWLTQGPAVPRFESAVAALCGTAYAVAVNSATSALHLACMALELGPGDWLWTTPNTFVASANCGRYCGAGVDFVDIDPSTWNMSIDALSAKLALAANTGRLPKVLVPVDFAGEPCDLRAIRALADHYGFAIIEDASHAVGALYGGARVGGTPWADITVFSFHPVKIITSAEGGMLMTRHQALADRLARLRSHGITRDASLMQTRAQEPWYYEQLELGYNYRMTDVQAALGHSQLNRLDAYVARRHELASRYDELLADLPVTTQRRASCSRSALHLYPVVLQESACRRTVFEAMRAAGIGVNVHYIPVHLQPYYRALGFAEGHFPQAEAYYASAISLPLYPALTQEEQDHVAVTLREALR